MSRALRLVLAEDSVLLREGLVELLGHFGHEVVAAVDDADALLAAVDADLPDVVVTDARMPPGFSDEGLRAAAELRRRHPGLGIMVLSKYAATAFAVELLAGASADAGLGYLLKDRVGAVGEFVDAVQRIADGTVIDPDVVRQLLDRRRAGEPLARLTPREREVLGQMADGKTNAAIAEALVVTEAAVVKHTGNIFAKLDLAPADGHRRVLAVLTYLRE